ncbi:MAG: hypothetical protein RI897_3979 [Verrucomicrobiota bacterium]
MNPERTRLMVGVYVGVMRWGLSMLAGMGVSLSGLELAVEVEEEVYTYDSANNGAGPMWCHGSTCLVRDGEEVYASGLETLEGAKPLNNCRWFLLRRVDGGWKRVLVDEVDRTREPSPLVTFGGGRVLLSANPTLALGEYSGAARPQILEFRFGGDSRRGYELYPWLPKWGGRPEFTEHSYRSFAADGERGELILFQNVGYTHAEWAFLDRRGEWSARGQLKWPWGAGYAKPEPIRVCYPNVAVVEGAVYFCGVSDIIEPNPEWRAFKKELTGQQWDYDFRRLFFTWTPDVRTEGFREWVEVASRESTCGWITPGDLHVGEDGVVHVLWSERALDERLRDRFYPGEKQRHALEYARVRDGKVVMRRTLVELKEGEDGAVPGRGRFHVTPDGKLWVVYYASGSGVDALGRDRTGNWVVEVLPDGSLGELARVPLKVSFGDFFTASMRAGNRSSWKLDLLGTQSGKVNTMSYACIRLGDGGER